MSTKKVRGFEIVKGYEDKGINLPKRATYNAAGYDLEAAEKIVLPSFWKQLASYLKALLTNDKVEAKRIIQPVLVPTGVKAYMQPDEYLKVVNRSSNPLKRDLQLPNGIGIIDADYYGNAGNDGEIFVQLLNYGPQDVVIEKGERIAQGIFCKYMLADNDTGGLEKRSGGFGSSGY